MNDCAPNNPDCQAGSAQSRFQGRLRVGPRPDPDRLHAALCAQYSGSFETARRWRLERILQRQRTGSLFFELTGDRLTIRTPEQQSGILIGKRTVATLVWEREAP
jgi:hypothetical protein